MNLRLLAGLSLILWTVSGCATTDGSGTATGGSASAATSADDEQEASLPELKAGMTGEEIVKLAGKPDKVVTLHPETGEAEEWTYRRLIANQAHQVATGVTIAPAYNPVPGGGAGEAPEPTYTLEHVKTYQVTALLLFNDKLIKTTVHSEQKRYTDQ